jgi:hypothetical protein
VLRTVTGVMPVRRRTTAVEGQLPCKMEKIGGSGGSDSRHSRQEMWDVPHRLLTGELVFDRKEWLRVDELLGWQRERSGRWCPL